MDASLRDILIFRELELNQHRLSQIQARVLYLLRSQKGGVNITSISKMLARKPHSISELITRMEYEGLVVREIIPPRRTINVTITKRGEQLYSSAYRKSLKSIFSVLSGNEHNNPDKYLKKLRAKSREIIGETEITPFLA